MKKVIDIKGMHCRSCEILVKENLLKINSVKNVHANFRTGNVQIESKQDISDNEIQKAITNAGYLVGKDVPRTWIARDFKVYRDLIFGLIIIGIIYLIISNTGISLNSFNSPSRGISIAILTGLIAGFSTCMTLVGGLVLGISARFAEKHPNSSALQKFRPHIFFNLGRITSFFIFGGIIGLVGKSFQFSVLTFAILIILVALVMLLIGLQLIDLFPKLSSFSLALPSGINKILKINQQKEKEYSHTKSILIGAITFFLPCGFTQAMQMFALSTGNFLSGALIMSLFALGTTPGLLSIGAITAILKGSFAKTAFRFSGLVVIIFAFLNLSNGLNLTGIRWLHDTPSSDSKNASSQNVRIENNVQIVRMVQNSRGYNPNNFVIKKGIPVKWIIDSQNLSTCAASIYSADLNIRRILNSGENIIEFTPQKTGDIPFSCSMGMYRGDFEVQENTSSISSPSISPNATPSTTLGAQAQDEQVLLATFDKSFDITPKIFNINASKPARMEIDVKDYIVGCMSTVAIPGLVDNFEPLVQGQKTILKFNPKPGTFYLTCAMGTKRAQININ